MNSLSDYKFSEGHLPYLRLKSNFSEFMRGLKVYGSKAKCREKDHVSLA